jgi:transcriptional regulator with XRE-family HTH domain
MLEQKSQPLLSLHDQADLYPVGMAFKDRFRTALKDAGLKQKDVAREADVTPQAVSGWARGEAMPESPNLQVISKLTGRSIDWLLGQSAGEISISSEDVSASLDAAPRRTIKVKGYVGAGGVARYYASNQGDFDEILAREKDPPSAVAVEITGGSLGLFFDRWYAIYRDVRSPVTEDLVGSLCVVGLDDDRVLIKKIVKNGKSYDLYSNTDDEPPIRDVKIEWAAKVTDVRQK